MTIALKASLSARRPSGRFPRGSFARVLTPAREQVRRDTELAFARQADPVNWRRWAPRKGEYDWPPLNRSGLLRAEAIRAASTATVRGSTLVLKLRRPKYAKFQAKGTRTIRPRRFLGVSLQVLNATRKRLKAEGLRAFRGRG